MTLENDFVIPNQFAERWLQRKSLWIDDLSGSDQMVPSINHLDNTFEDLICSFYNEDVIKVLAATSTFCSGRWTKKAVYYNHY